MLIIEEMMEKMMGRMSPEEREKMMKMMLEMCEVIGNEGFKTWEMCRKMRQAAQS